MTKHADRDRSEPYWPPAATRKPRVPAEPVIIPPIPRPCRGCGVSEAEQHIDDCPAVIEAVNALPSATTEAQHDLRPGKYAEAMASGFGYRCAGAVPEDAIRAVMAVADAELREHGRDCREVARKVYEGDLANLRAEVNRWLLRAQAAEALEAAHRERAEEAEATVARVEASLRAWQVGPWNGSTRHLLAAVEAALAEPEPCPHTCSCTSDQECPHDCPCDASAGA